MLQPCMEDDPAWFEEHWKSWEHQVKTHEKLAGSTVDFDVKVSFVIREVPPKLKEHLLMNSEQSQDKGKSTGEDRGTSKSKEGKPDASTRERIATRDQSTEFVFAVENSIHDVTLSQSGCGVSNAG